MYKRRQPAMKGQETRKSMIVVTILMSRMTLIRVVPQNHRATTLHARATSASLARDWSSAKMASMAFSTCTWARSRHLFRPGGQRIEGKGCTAGDEEAVKQGDTGTKQSVYTYHNC
jgi:hypothetical protein